MISNKNTGDKQKITIVDDEKGMVSILKKFLEKRNYLVNVAYDGESGLEVIRKCLPDLIILDIVMPKMDGRDVLVELKKDDTTKQIPVIMLTARGEDFEKDYGMELGAHEYLPKPCDLNLLLAYIDSILRR